MAKYGKTWWGQQWLKSLSHIDFSNRLPRGSAYASRGAVVDLKIKTNKISAKVQGTRRTPYKIDINIPLFDAQQKKDILKAVNSNPMVLSELLNHKLPSEIMDIAKQKNIPVFPKTWKDFDMSCSCPDWAVPCKHLAAVIYIMANEIDRNPFEVFKLHGLDIMKEIENSGMLKGNKKSTFAKASDFLADKIKPTNEKNLRTSKDIDFSFIPDLKAQLFSLLTPKPIFYTSDFTTILKKAYTKTSREVTNILKENIQKENIDNEISISQLGLYENVEILLNNELFYFDTILTGTDIEKHFSLKKGFYSLIQFISSIPDKYVDRLSPALKGLYFAYQFALKLLQNNAYIPQIIELSTKQYYIRWIPALSNKEVNFQFEIISDMLPKSMLLEVGSSYNNRYYEKTEQTTALLSLFLSHHIYSATIDYQFGIDNITELFFDGKPNKFTAIGEREIPVAIQQWLNPFFVTHGKFVPVIQIEEDEDEYFAIELLVDNNTDTLQAPVHFSEFMLHDKYAPDRMSVLSSLSILIEYFPDLKKVVKHSGDIDLTYSSEEFTDVLLKILPAIEMLGIRILFPKALKNLVRPKLSLSLATSGDKKPQSFFSLSDMLNFRYKVALGDQFVDPDEFSKMVADLSGIVKIKGQYILIDKAEIQKLLKNIGKDIHPDNNELLRIALSEEYKGANINITAKARKIVQELLKVDNLKIPDTIKATLRPYQERGYEWLYKNAKAGFGSIIADDMGLGKTLQVITALQQMKNEGKLKKHKALIIVPTTLLTNWMHEIDKFAPELNAAVYHGTKRKLDTTDLDLLITTYGISRSDEKLLAKQKWEVIAIDEAQNIKNPGTAQTKAVKKLKAPVKIAMSGTPVENRLSEYWSIFDFVNKGYLGSLKYFQKEFSTPIEKEHSHKHLEIFKKITSPFIMRRLKTDKTIISDLPDKIQSDTYTNLTKEQAALYKSVVKELMPQIDTAPEKERMKRQGTILKLIIALKQICNHPLQYIKKGKADPNLSGKTMMLFNLLDGIYENNEKVLIFTQFKEMGAILEKLIEERYGKSLLFLHGGTSRKKRDTYVDDFQNKSNIHTFILSIKAGGTGLNLTAAQNVIHYDLWWNPAVESQATDRAYRIGQKNNVMVYRMITKGTFEEKINEMIIKKRELANLAVETGENWIGNLSNKEIAELVKIR